MIFKLIIISLVFTGNAIAQNTPKIESVSQVGENSVKLTWSTNTQSTSPSRYRILVTNNNWNTSYEWPTQIERVDSDVYSTVALASITQSAFECYNKCLNDAKCVFAIHKSIERVENCFLKYSAPGNNGTAPDSEYIKITSYNNVTTLINLPHNEIYKFKVSVFDSKSEAWSDFSDSSNAVDMTIKLKLKFERTGWNSSKISWTQGSYSLSRFSFKIQMNDSHRTEIPSTDSLEIYPMYPNYIEENYNDSFVVGNLLDCAAACYNVPDCVNFVYFNGSFMSVPKHSCILRNKFEITKAVNAPTGVFSWGVRSKLEEYKIENIEINSNVKVTVECITVYGTACVNTEISYNFTDLAPDIIQTTIWGGFNSNFTWRTRENLNYTRFAFFFTMNKTEKVNYVHTPSQDYDDPDAPIIKTDNKEICFENCFNNSKCLAYAYKKQQCELKFNLSSPKACGFEKYCGSIPGYRNQLAIFQNYGNTFYSYQVMVQTSFGANSAPSDPMRLLYSYGITIEQVDEFIPERYARLRCLAYGDFIKKVAWFKDRKPFDPEKYNAKLSDDGTFVNFEKVAYNASGVYYCTATFFNGQVFESENDVMVEVKKIPPMRPEISRALTAELRYGYVTLFEWKINFGYELPQTCFYLEALHGQKEHNETFYACEDSIRGGSLIMNKTFSDDVNLRFAVQNEMGLSEMSSWFRVENGPKDLPKTDSYYSSYVVTLVFFFITLGCLVGIIMMLFIYKKRLSDGHSIKLLRGKY